MDFFLSRTELNSSILKKDKKIRITGKSVIDSIWWRSIGVFEMSTENDMHGVTMNRNQQIMWNGLGSLYSIWGKYVNLL